MAAAVSAGVWCVPSDNWRSSLRSALVSGLPARTSLPIFEMAGLGLWAIFSASLAWSVVVGPKVAPLGEGRFFLDEMSSVLAFRVGFESLLS